MKHTRGTDKRLLSAFLCLVMLLALAPVAVFAEDLPEEIEPEGQANYTVNYTVLDANGNTVDSGSAVYSGTVGEWVTAPERAPLLAVGSARL